MTDVSARSKYAKKNGTQAVPYSNNISIFRFWGCLIPFEATPLAVYWSYSLILLKITA